MNRVFRFSLMLLMLVSLGLSYGCAKEQVAASNTPSGDGEYGVNRPMTAEESSAAAVISDAKIYFEYDRFDISAESKRVLTSKADVLKRFSQFRVIIEGHCDERGTDEYNLALGERRAKATYEYLVMLGVNPSQLEMISMGKMHPAVDGHSESAWKLNRRCEFKVGLIK